MASWKPLIQSLIGKDRPGLEIGPFCNPLASRREGFRTTIVDITTQEELQAKARRLGKPETAINAIERVDGLGDASQLSLLLKRNGLSGRYSWIISSHNFEHLPDPVLFLQDCSEHLEHDGKLLLVIPDQRYTMDRFQPHTTTAQLLKASMQPDSPGADAWLCFEQASMGCSRLLEGDRRLLAWSPAEENVGELTIRHGLDVHFQRLLARREDANFRYHGHRWRMTPAVFELLMFDLGQLGLIHLSLAAIHQGGRCDFLAHITPRAPERLPSNEATAHRVRLCQRVEDEQATISSHCRELENRIQSLEDELRALRGGESPSTPGDPAG